MYVPLQYSQRDDKDLHLVAQRTRQENRYICLYGDKAVQTGCSEGDGEVVYRVAAPTGKARSKRMKSAHDNEQKEICSSKVANGRWSPSRHGG